MHEKRLFWRRNLTALRVQGIFLILSMVVFVPPALAHRVLVYAYAEGDTIHTESKFVPDTPVRQGKILVMDQKTDQVLLRGETDDQGKFSFKIPAEAVAEKLDLKIVVEAAMGHRGEWQMRAQSYLPDAETTAGVAVRGVPTSGAAAIPATAASPAVSVPAVDRQLLEDALNKTLERQLAPIKEMLTELTIHRTSPTDVIGGIGYIMGIFGLLAYFQSRKKKDS
jgi:nickel transport protein